MESQFVDEDVQHLEQCSENTSDDDDQYSDGELKDDQGQIMDYNKALMVLQAKFKESNNTFKK